MIEYLSSIYNDLILPNGSAILQMILGGIIAVLFPNSKYGKASWKKTLEIKDYITAGIRLYFLTRKLTFLSGMEDHQNNVTKDDPVMRKALVSLAVRNGYYLAVKQVFEDSGYVFKEYLINSMTKIISIDLKAGNNKSLMNSTMYVITIPTELFGEINVSKVQGTDNIALLPPY